MMSSNKAIADAKKALDDLIAQRSDLFKQKATADAEARKADLTLIVAKGRCHADQRITDDARRAAGELGVPIHLAKQTAAESVAAHRKAAEIDEIARVDVQRLAIAQRELAGLIVEAERRLLNARINHSNARLQEVMSTSPARSLIKSLGGMLALRKLAHQGTGGERIDGLVLLRDTAFEALAETDSQWRDAHHELLVDEQ